MIVIGLDSNETKARAVIGLDSNETKARA